MENILLNKVWKFLAHLIAAAVLRVLLLRILKFCATEKECSKPKSVS